MRMIWGWGVLGGNDVMGEEFVGGDVILGVGMIGGCVWRVGG